MIAEKFMRQNVKVYQMAVSPVRLHRAAGGGCHEINPAGENISKSQNRSSYNVALLRCKWYIGSRP